ncbi:DEAD/DEAH box helicase [Desulfospira joergensenii]|uniref:DEAD/DEAH box helicase n=1 Tax=Desulfospira joergensenii TaxID=53329 RepID=UPI0003B37A2E|nr:DEAD/DEAH box helicase [Desulfospira joergensenii]
MSLAEYIRALKNYKGFSGDIVCHRTLPGKEPVFARDSLKLKHDPGPLLRALDIDRLYSHQARAVERISRGVHTVIATPTASGKSLVYNLPVIDAVLENPDSKALYLFPLKALARDQLGTVQKLLKIAGLARPDLPPLRAEVYDGDISSYKKTKIRRDPPQVLLSNPEMLHLAMLAHHHLWEDFFSSLKFVVIDEVHTYRGVMGSNMAWVFRRLRRICRHYGSDPVFIFCSATIANPADLCSRLTGLTVQVVDEAGAPSGRKEVLLMRGLEGAAQTAIALIHSAVHRNLRTIVYTQSRKITELIAMWASQRAKGLGDKISAYRAGFLPEERRDIENKLSSGELLAVVSTSALELGIDIGSLDLCVLVGYPGTMMSTWQRAGRVGRAGRDSAMVLIAHEDALDQYFINHPDVFFNMDPEQAVINPGNPIIMEKHLECAGVELSLKQGEPFLEMTGVKEGVSGLENKGKLLRSRDGGVWFGARKAPHREVSLRGTGQSIPIFLEKTGESLGEIDRHRAFFETHEGAVYLHRGRTYAVTRFDHEKGVVEAREKRVNYYTRARSSKNTEIIQVQDQKRIKGTRVGLGRLRILEQVTGYERKQVSNQKSLGVVPLDLPRLEFETQGLWIEIPDRVRDEIESRSLHFMGGIHALEHAAIGIMPLLVMTDRNDLGGISIPFHPQTEKAAVFIYDGVPGGLGLSKQAFDRAGLLLARTLDVIRSCPCETGCPACVHSPKCGSGNRPIDKFSAHKILDLILGNGIDERFCDILRKEGDIEMVEKEDSRNNEMSLSNESQSDKKGKDLRYGVLDIETRRSAAEVGGWNRAERMGVSCAVVYDSKSDSFHDYLQEDMDRLKDHLKEFDLVIGFNIIRFDYKVLSGLSDFDFHSLPTLDILLKVHQVLGYRLSLDHLAQQTLETKKSADGLMALKWWKQGKMDQIIKYCRQDVRVTRDLYRFGKENQFLLFKNKAGSQVRVPVSW